MYEDHYVSRRTRRKDALSTEDLASYYNGIGNTVRLSSRTSVYGCKWAYAFLCLHGQSDNSTSMNRHRDHLVPSSLMGDPLAGIGGSGQVRYVRERKRIALRNEIRVAPRPI
jgi:hypothetical protein